MLEIAHYLVGDSGLSGLISNTTGVLAEQQTDVTVLTPRGVPAVADAPVLLVGRRIHTKTSELHAVVQSRVSVLATGGRSQHSASVRLPHRGIDADGDRTILVKVLGEKILVLVGAGVSATGSGIDETGDLGNDGRCVVSASTSNTRVTRHIRVAGLSLDTGNLHVSIGSNSVTTVATLITALSVAVDGLLRSQLDGVVTLEDVGRLDGLSGREGPARTALTLILDGGDSDGAVAIRSAPVKVGGERGRLEGLADLSLLAEEGVVTDGGLEVQVLALELNGVEIRELVDTECGRRVELLQLLSALHVLGEDGEAVSLMSIGLVGLAVLVLELGPLILKGGDARATELSEGSIDVGGIDLLVGGGGDGVVDAGRGQKRQQSQKGAQDQNTSLHFE